MPTSGIRWRTIPIPGADPTAPSPDNSAPPPPETKCGGNAVARRPLRRAASSVPSIHRRPHPNRTAAKARVRDRPGRSPGTEHPPLRAAHAVRPIRVRSVPQRSRPDGTAPRHPHRATPALPGVHEQAFRPAGRRVRRWPPAPVGSAARRHRLLRRSPPQAGFSLRSRAKA